MIDTEFIKQHVERRDLTHRPGVDTRVNGFNERRRSKYDVRLTTAQSIMLICMPVAVTLYIVYKIITF